MRIPEGEVPEFLKFYGLKEDPAISRDFTRTELVDRVVAEVQAGQSLRILGVAGIGKSALMREIKSELHNLNQNYVPTLVKFEWLVDHTQTRIDRDGLIALGHYVVDDYNNFFKQQQQKHRELSKKEQKKVKRDDWPTRTKENRDALQSLSNKIGVGTRFFHFQKLFEKLENDDYKTVILLDDADALQYFTKFNCLDDLIDISHSVIFCYKPAQERDLVRKSFHKEEDQTHTELTAQRERLEAFLRRSLDVKMQGQTATTTLKIVRGKLNKQKNVILDEALAYGFLAAYCAEIKPKTMALEYYGKEATPLNKPTKLYNPGKIGIFLSRCVRLGFEQKEKPIEVDIAKKAYTETALGFRPYEKVSDVDVSEPLAEIVAARKILDKSSKKPRKKKTKKKK